MARRFSRVRFIAAAVLCTALAVLPAQAGRAAVSAGHAHAGMPTVRMAFSTWTGYGPLVVAVEKGIFKKYGLNVRYQIVEDPTARFAAFRAGSRDVGALARPR